MMITEDKIHHALHAINGILIQLRVWALRNEDHTKIATVLDIAEELPRFLSSAEDQTRAFEATLKNLAERFPEFSLGLERYLRKQDPGVW